MVGFSKHHELLFYLPYGYFYEDLKANLINNDINNGNLKFQIKIIIEFILPKILF